MGPKKDLIKPLVESCREQGLKFGFYFSLEEWEYPVINDNGTLGNRIWCGKTGPYLKEYEKKSSGKVAVRNYAEDYIVPQTTEFIDRYDPDILWYDVDWSTSVYDLHSYDISACFYNKAQGRKEVAVNDSYGVEKDGKCFVSEEENFLQAKIMIIQIMKKLIHGRNAGVLANPLATIGRIR
jgi:alpha-L-fucosidase